MDERERQMLGILMERYKADIDITTPTAQRLHDQGGLLSWPAQRSSITNAMITPRSGLEMMIPVRSSNRRNDLYGILTGLTASTGTNPTEPCEPGRQPGDLKLCNQAFPWGRFVASSRVIDTTNVAWLRDRGDFIDHKLIGNPFANMTAPAPGNPNNFLNNVVESELLKLWVAFYRDNMDVIYQGDYGAYQTLTPSQGHFPYNGLDLILNDGKVDVLTGTACDAANSLVEDAGGKDIASNAEFYVNIMTDILHFQRRLSERVGLAPVTYGWSMDDGTFRALTRVWPCAYNISNCAVGGVPALMNSSFSPEQRKMQDELYQGRYLLFDGERIPIIIEETEVIGGTSVVNANGTRTYTVNIKLVPLQSPMFTESGGWITYKERLSFTDSYGLISTQEAIQRLAPTGVAEYMEGGTVLMLKEWKHGCVYVTLIKNERLIVEAPFLGARLDNVSYTPRYAERSAFPGGNGFDGGGYVVGPTINYPQT